MRPLVFFAWIEQVTFFILLYVGREELGIKGIGGLVVLWVGVMFALRFVQGGSYLFSTFVAILDIILVLVIFKGDVTIR